MRIAILLIAASLAFGQTDRGNITGSVTDPSGSAVVGATVEVVNTATNVGTTVKTTATGDYNAADLRPGAYRVEVSADGFKHVVQENVVLGAAGTVAVNLQLSLGSVSETVEVTAAVAQVQTENAKTSTSVQNRLVDELPLVVSGSMRSPYDLVTMTSEGRGSGDTFSLGGGQARAFEVTLDGVSVGTNRSSYFSEIGYNSPSLEAITEFTVDTNGFKAEYGHAGGGAITFVSKSGTNQVHGDAYEFLRNTDLDARSFFAQTRSVYRQSDFGVTFGGPVYLPKLYNGHDKTFFFLSYEGFRNRQGANGTYASIPTPEMYRGDFSKWVNASGQVLPIYDPSTQAVDSTGAYTRQPFPNNQIPQSQFSAFAKTLIPIASKVTPNAPNIGRGGIYYIQNNYLSSGGTFQAPQDKGGMKLDHSLTQKQRLSFFMNFTRYRYDPGPEGPPGLPVPLYSGAEQVHFNSDVYRLTHDWTITPSMLNHVAVGVNLFDKISGSPNIWSGTNWKQAGVCLAGTVDCSLNFPMVSFSEFSGWGGNSWNGTRQPLASIQEDFSWIHSSHTFKFGFSYQDQHATGIAYQTISGSAGFDRLGTSVPGQTTNLSGSSFASFLLGNAQSGGTQTANVIADIYPYYGFYAQDDWRVSRRLVVNFGVRYDVTLPPREPFDRYSDFSPITPNPAVNNYPGALIFAGYGAGRLNTRTLVPGWYKGIGPRLGVAYSISPKTTIRAAFGRSFDKVTTPHGYGNYMGFAGTYSWSSQNSGITPAFMADVGLPPHLPTPQINPAFSNNQSPDYFGGADQMRAPENLYWTFSTQRQLTPNTVLEATYNANVGTHLRAPNVNFNQVPTSTWNQLVQRYGASQAVQLLNSNINSTMAKSAGITAPYANFLDSSVQAYQTVNQALRPFPQYLTINASSRNGDHSGHASYHAMVVKLEHRFSKGVTLQWNYTFSKLLTDSDDFRSQGLTSQDQSNRGLEKSIGGFDQTHAVKMSTIYELPFGLGQRWMNRSRLVDAFLGSWRLAALQSYGTGFPLGVTVNNPLPIFNGATRPTITSYDNWCSASGNFDPAVNVYLNRSAFPSQPINFGNSTRFNPLCRAFPSFNENVSLGKAFHLHESVRIDFRAEAFNVLNRVVFGNPNANLSSVSFGIVTTQANTPRQMQLGLKLYW